jgi:hypothetical protein
MSSLPNPHDVERDPFSKVPDAVLNAGYSDGAVRCYLQLDDYWRSNKDECWPGQDRLAREMGVSRRTAQYRLDELAGLSVRGQPPKPACIRKVRRGRGDTNVYVRLPQQRHLRAVSDAQPVARLDAQSVAHKAKEVEADTEQHRKSIDRVEPLNAVRTRHENGDQAQPLDDEDRLRVVRYMEETLLPVLRDLHRSKRVALSRTTGTTVARLILSTPGLHEGHIAHVCDRLTGNVPDRRFSVFDVDAIENPAAYAFAALESYFAEDYPSTLPATYAQPVS